MASALFGLLAVQSLFSGVAARPPCHAVSVLSSTTVSATVSSSSSVELSSSTESELPLTVSTTASSESDSPSSTESPLTVSTTVSSESDVPSSTESPSTVSTTLSTESDTPSSTEPSLASSTVFSATTTAPYCDPTPTYLPEYCWVSVPSVCSTLNRTPTLPLVFATPTASACRAAFSANGALATAVAGCFESIGRPQFNPTSAYSCVSAASVYCQSTTASCDPLATPTPTPINGGFESGDLSPWIVGQFITSPSTNIDASVTSEQSHSGGKSLKVAFQNLDGASVRWQQAVKLVPGASYELSYWFFSANTQAYSGVDIGLSMPGKSIYINTNTDTGPLANQWNRISTHFVAATSFGTISVGFSANKGPAGNTVYFDDIALNLV